MKYKFFTLLLLIPIISLSACSAQPELSISEVWARPGIVEGNTGVFFVIDNPTNQDDRLLSAESEFAEAVELHKTTIVDDVMHMSPQEFVDIPAGEQVVFKPGDLHVMLINLTEQLNVGDSFKLSLNFENAGKITLTVTANQP
jgi:copper(I)-binding protein